MRMISAGEVHDACDWTGLVDALARAHQAERPLQDHAAVTARVRGDTQTFINLPAMLPGRAFGSKIITVVPDNPDRRPGTPAIQALYVLFDGDDGTPRAVIDGTALTYRKTAADSALGSRLLARRDAATLLMVGAGGLSPWLARAHMAVRPSISRVLVWNRSRPRAEAVATELGGEVVDNLEAAVRQADVLSCCTASETPLVHGAWLKPGCHLDLVGGYTPAMREVDDDAVARARLFVDNAPSNIDSCGDLISPIARGVVDRAKVEADLFDLCATGVSPGRADDDITLFKNGGGGHLDLFTALFILERMDCR